MNHELKIHHELADVILTPVQKINAKRLKQMISNTLDQYMSEEPISAELVHAYMKHRHGAKYQSPGYYLRLFRLRVDLTQVQLAQKAGIRQHHISEMEANKRPIGKSNAKKLSKILNCSLVNLLG